MLAKVKQFLLQQKEFKEMEDRHTDYHKVQQQQQQQVATHYFTVVPQNEMRARPFGWSIKHQEKYMKTCQRCQTQSDMSALYLCACCDRYLCSTCAVGSKRVLRSRYIDDCILQAALSSYRNNDDPTTIPLLQNKIDYIICGHCLYAGTINTAMEALCKENKNFARLSEYSRRELMIDKIVDERHSQLEQLIKASGYCIRKYCL